MTVQFCRPRMEKSHFSGHEPRGRDVNIFDIVVFEIPMYHVKRQKTAVYAQYACVCNKFNIMESTGIVSKLYVQIELKKKNDELRNYQYGPFPTFRTAASQCVS